MTIDQTYHVLFSDFMNPSNYERVCVQDKGSIKGSLAGYAINHSPLWKAKLTYPIGLPSLFWMMRVVTLVAIVTLATATAFSKEIFSLGKHSIKLLKGEDSILIHHAVKLSTVLGAIAVTIGNVYGIIHLSSLPILVKILPLASISITSLCLAITAARPMLLFAFFRREDIIPRMKSVFLKYEFGIVGQEGKLLTCDSTKDNETNEENNIDGNFSHLYVLIAMKIYQLIEQIQLRLPLDKKMQSIIDSEGFPKKSNIFDHLAGNNFLSDEYIQIKAKKLEEAFAKIEKIREFLEEAIRFRDRETFKLQFPTDASLAFTTNTDVQVITIVEQQQIMDMQSIACA